MKRRARPDYLDSALKNPTTPLAVVAAGGLAGAAFVSDKFADRLKLIGKKIREGAGTFFEDTKDKIDTIKDVLPPISLPAPPATSPPAATPAPETNVLSPSVSKVSERQYQYWKNHLPNQEAALATMKADPTKIRDYRGPARAIEAQERLVQQFKDGIAAFEAGYIRLERPVVVPPVVIEPILPPPLPTVDLPDPADFEGAVDRGLSVIQNILGLVKDVSFGSISFETGEKFTEFAQAVLSKYAPWQAVIGAVGVGIGVAYQATGADKRKFPGVVPQEVVKDRVDYFGRIAGAIGSFQFKKAADLKAEAVSKGLW